MDIYKKWNIGLSIATAVVAVGVWLYFGYACGGHKCSVDLIDVFLKPILWSTLPLAIVLLSMIAFQSKCFKQWLLHIVSWSIPLSVYFILDQNPRQSGPFGIDRSDLAWTFGTLIFLLTVIYTLGWHIYEWRKGRVAGRDFARLSVFFISGAIFYSIWQLF